MVKTRAQRVANDENGITQSPPQILSTPVRKPKKGAAGRSLNGTTRDMTRSTQTNGKVSESEESVQQMPITSTITRKTRLRNAARQVKSQTQNTAIFSDEPSESSARESEEPSENPQVNGNSKRLGNGNDQEPVKKRRKANQAAKKDTKPNINGQSTGSSVSTNQPAVHTNASLFSMFSQLTPRKSEAPTTNGSSAPTPASRKEPEEKPTASPEQEQQEQQEQPRLTRNMKSKTRRQRVLQERDMAPSKQTVRKSPLSIKRKREEVHGDSEDELSDAPELKKKTARWSFKPNDEGNLALLPRDEIDPADESVVYVDGEEAAKLISQEFERKKQVRFADRIAKRHAESTEAEKAAHQARLEEQNLQLTTQDFFGNSLTRNGDVRALARRLDAGNMTMLERIENLSNGNDEDLREDLARDLMELAFAIRAAGPQSKSMSPVENNQELPWSNSQDNKENDVASSPEAAPLRIEAPPTPSAPTTDSPKANTTPGRLFASIRKIRSYLPFGGSVTESIQPSLPHADDLTKSPSSPTPAYRQGNQQANKPDSFTGQNDNKQISKLSASDNEQHKSQTAKTAPIPTTPTSKRGDLSDANRLRSTRSTQSKTAFDQQQSAAVKKSADMVKEMNDKWNSSSLNRLPQTPGSLKRKLGSESYPLTADGKIPRPAPNAYGINDDYFYGADSSSDSEGEDEPIIKRRRVLPRDATSSRSRAENTRLTRSAPRPTTTRPALKTPTPRIYAAPDLSASDSDGSDEELEQISSVERRDQERERIRAERLKNAADAHKPKTPSRLRQMATVPPSPVDIKSRLQKHFRGQGCDGVFGAFAHV